MYFKHTVHFSNCAMGSDVNYSALVWYVVLQIGVVFSVRAHEDACVCIIGRVLFVHVREFYGFACARAFICRIVQMC